MAEEIPLFPLQTVLFPGMPLPLHIFEQRYRDMIGTCTDEDRPFGVVLIREGREVGGGAVPFEIGTKARIVGVDRLEDGRLNIVTVGTERFRIVSWSGAKKPYMVGEVEPLADPAETGAEAGELVRDIAGAVQRYVTMMQAASGQGLSPLDLPSVPGELSYLVGAVLRVPNEERQRLLEAGTAMHRLEMELGLLKRESAALEEFLQRQKGSLGPFSRN
jgi:Lon protease-like protein